MATHPAAPEGAPESTRRPWYELGMMSDPILDNVLLYYLGQAWQGTTDIGECLDTAARVDPEDEWSWTREWEKTADRLRRVGEASAAGGHRISAGEAYLRAATYYRAALHRHPDPFAPSVPRLAAQVIACHPRALELLARPAQLVAIPYEGTTLPGYFFRSPLAQGQAPLLIVHQGRDGWAEDCLYLAEGAIKRGYHALLFNGPGQGSVIRLQGLPFRPDWEKVITPVVDFAQAIPGVDADRLALLGLSMGGALAPRAAAFEKRLKLCIANPGVLDWSEVTSGFLAQALPAAMPLLESDPHAFNAAVGEATQASAFLRWGIVDTLWKHGANSPSDLMLKLRDFTNAGIVDRITCRTLVLDGTADPFSQATALFNALRCPKDYRLFTTDDTGLTHCQGAALAVATQRLFDWLDDYI